MADHQFHLVGNADALTAPGITARLDEVLRACDGELVIDCSGLEFIDSSGIGVLVRAREDLDANASLRIVNMPLTGRRAIEAVGLVEYLGLDENTTATQ
jgi:anti-anti-sigma factor